MKQGMTPRRLALQTDSLPEELPLSFRTTSNSLAFTRPTFALYNNAITRGNNFSECLWEASADITGQVYSGEYITGIKKGNLHPNDYGKYTLQDAIYCHHATKNLDLLHSRAVELGDKHLEDFAANRKQSFEKYAKGMFKEWHIKDPSGIHLSDSATQYIQLEERTVTAEAPLYTIIAMLPCEMLWSWLANKIDSELSPSEKSTNLYYFWVKDNMGNSSKFQTYINNRAEEIDADLAKKIYREAMTCEYNFFKSACQEGIAALGASSTSSMQPAANNNGNTAEALRFT